MLARIYPRLTQGGAETEILHLLQAWPGTRMIVTHDAGTRADQARVWSDLRLLAPADRWRQLCEELEEVHTAHLHCINHHLGFALMAQIAGVSRIMQTVHNAMAPASEALVDHQIVPSHAVASLQDEAILSAVVPSGVHVPKRLIPFNPWHRAHRRPRLVEIRRPGKEMAFELDELVASGAVGEVELWVIGVEGRSCGRVRYFGEIKDPSRLLSRCDVLVHASATESYGRTPREAMASGVIPAVTALPAFLEAFDEQDVAFLPTDPHGAAQALRDLVARLADSPEDHASWRLRNHTRVATRGSVPVMVEAHKRWYSWAPIRDRLIRPEELSDPLATATRVGRIVDGQAPEQLGELDPAEQALTLWLLAHEGRLPIAQILPALEKANTLLPERFVVLRDLGAARLEAGDAQGALAVLEQALKIRPASRSTHMLHVQATYATAGPKLALVAAEEGVLATGGGELGQVGEKLRAAA
jgi:hypothetical protein